ncbi:Cobalt-zinc-cadmium resistance protein CzcA; Cation efflux system protein CusA [Collimonas arenae]|uniref:Cobalt-zinc-cadmium resistance protein CzcA Cation efflux system protein CusA n=1 Tax=Collimonas arenae TaxID=279058 RepID=A0A0A1F839_9BURK|nr:efflux RND transporter permease subunit [Collimonas arenae]AIY40883.1 Cobalt-zinc-cadmium resistance protein CzcA; Cation efflux system protein CusA [Collimonas arenae]
MSVASWISSHRRSILFLMAVLALGGAIAAFQLPTSLFPTVDFPRVVVSLDAGDQPPQQMEMLVTRPVEEAVRRVPGVKNVRSTTARGSAEISVNFDWGLDMASATLQVNAATAQIMSQLPPGTVVQTRRMDPTVFPIIAYSLTSATVSPVKLRDLADYQLRPLLSGVPGVAQVQAIGGALEEYQVEVDPQKLLVRSLTADDVARTLSANNVINVVGRLEDHYKLYLVMSEARLQTIEQIQQTVLSSGVNGVVRVQDVATVKRSTVPEWIRVTADGRSAVLLSIYQQPGSNSVQIANDVKTKLRDFQSQLPAGVSIANWYDQSELVTASASSVRDAILIGIGLAALVLLVFLRNVKITLIAVIVVPAVLATTVVVVWLLNMSFNIMTLGGMAAAVGLIIDDAIVMIEHIVRRLHGSKEAVANNVMNSALEFFRPLLGSSASTLIIFAPLAFLSGVTGAFFKALSVTMATSLFISFLITWLAVPVLASKFLNEKDANADQNGRITLWFHEKYTRIMLRLLKQPVLVLLAVIPLLGAGYIGFQHVGSGFMPSMDEGGFVLDYYTEPGTAVTETDRLVRQLEAIVQQNPNVQTYSRRTGTGLGGGISEPNHGDFFVRLKQGKRQPVDQVMEQIRARTEQEIPGLHTEMAQLMEDLIGDLTAVPQPVEIKIFSADPKALSGIATKVAARIAKINGVVDVKNGINPAGDALQVHIDPLKAAQEGLDPAAVTKTLSDSLSGNVTTQVMTDVKTIGLRVRLPQEMRQTDQDLGLLTVRAPDGHLLPLKRIASIDKLTGQAEINRENLKQMIAVTARISGRDLGSVITDVKKELAQPGLLPQGSYFQLGGLYEQQRIAFQGLMTVFAAAAVLVFLLLLFMYESFRLAGVILFTSLISVSAVFVGLSLTGIDLNISAMMGMTMIIGIVTEVAIFYFSEQQDLMRSTDRISALIEAGKNRMRPIAMTTLAAILTLLPLALALGEGSEMQQPLAIAIISGLLVQLPLVLVVMPVIYSTLKREDIKRPGA